MPRVLVRCCSRCGSSFGTVAWAGTHHNCPDGIMGEAGDFPVGEKPKLDVPPGTHTRVAPGKCPNCQNEPTTQGGAMVCYSCGCREVEPGVHMVEFQKWEHANDSVGVAFLQVIGQRQRDVSYIYLDDQGSYSSHQLTTKAAECNQDKNGTNNAVGVKEHTMKARAYEAIHTQLNMADNNEKNPAITAETHMAVFEGRRATYPYAICTSPSGLRIQERGG